MLTIFLLVFLGLVAAVLLATYLAANVLLVLALMYTVPPLWRKDLQPLMKRLGRFGAKQLNGISTRRIHVLCSLQLCALVLLYFLLTSEWSLLVVATGLAGYTLFACMMTVSLLSRLPAARHVWNDPASRIVVWGLPIACTFIARGYASSWVGDLTGVSAANTPYALIVATALLLAVPVAIVLAVLSLIFEASFLCAPIVSANRLGKTRARAFWVLGVSTFLFTFAGFRAAAELPSARVGNAVISAVVFEFDAGPANPCLLSRDERELVDRDQPILRALYLATDQEKAVLVKREPALFREFKLQRLSGEEASRKRVTKLRQLDCFIPDALQEKA